MFFSKSIGNGHIIAAKNERVLYYNNEIAEILNNFFSNITIALEILQNV